jgi:hypothetical protein
MIFFIKKSLKEDIILLDLKCVNTLNKSPDRFLSACGGLLIIIQDTSVEFPGHETPP